MSKVSVFLKEAVSRNLSKLKRWELPANGDYDGKMPNSRFMEDVNKCPLIFLSVSELEYDS